MYKPASFDDDDVVILMSNFIAHDSINLNARCAEGVGGREGNRKKKAMLIKIKTHGPRSFREQVGFQTCGMLPGNLLP